MTTFVDCINDVRDSLDKYTRERTDINLVMYLSAVARLTACHDAEVLPRSLERQERTRLAQRRAP